MGDKRRFAALAALSVDDAYELSCRLGVPVWELVRSLLGKPLDGLRNSAEEIDRVDVERGTDQIHVSGAERGLVRQPVAHVLL